MKIIFYTQRTKKIPFSAWINTLDKTTQAIILTRIDRMRDGNFGDYKSIQGSNNKIFELRIEFGPGYRVYFGRDKATIIVLLIGGDKKSQTRDIEKAKKYWLDYKETSNE